MEKWALRKSIIQKRSHISATESRAAGEAVAALLAHEGFYQKARSLFCYVSVEGEVDTEPIIDMAFTDGKGVYVPRTAADGALETVPVSEREYARARAEWPRSYGIPEPPAHMPDEETLCPDLVLVPSLATDRCGCRLGHGGGYYDRFIARARAEQSPPLFAAIQFHAFLLDEKLPREAHDQFVDIIITENEVFTPVSSA